MRFDDNPPLQGNKMLAVLALVGSVGVGLGAFGAHALRDVLDDKLMEVWRTAVLYLFVHTLAGIFWSWRLPGRAAGFLFLAGILLFSGSLFALCLTGIRWLGAVTPFGGVTLIGAWAWAAWCEARLARPSSHKAIQKNTLQQGAGK